MTRLARFAAIFGGYVVAWCAAEAAVWFKNRGVSEADQLAMSGMFAFGDSVLFVGVAATLAIVPTVFLIRSLSGAPRFWRVYSILCLIASLTGLVAALFLVSSFQAEIPFLNVISSLSPIRVLAAPAFLLAFIPGILPSTGTSRRFLLLACFFELCTGASFLVWLFLARIAVK